MKRRQDDRKDAEAVSAWAWLDSETRAEVVLLARQGRLHPDPVVRAKAAAWAEAVLRRRPLGLVAAWLMLPIMMIANAPGDGTFPDLSDKNNPTRRKEARMILALGRAGGEPGPS